MHPFSIEVRAGEVKSLFHDGFACSLDKVGFEVYSLLPLALKFNLLLSVLSRFGINLIGYFGIFVQF